MKILNLLLLVLLTTSAQEESDNTSTILNLNQSLIQTKVHSPNQDSMIVELLESLRFSNLIDKHKVNEIPDFIFSFLEKEYSREFRITDSNRYFQNGCIIYPNRDRETYKEFMKYQGAKVDSTILMSLPKPEEICGRKLTFYAQGLSHSILNFHTSWGSTTTNVFIFKHNGKNGVAEFWRGKCPSNISTSEELIHYFETKDQPKDIFNKEINRLFGN